MALQSDSFFCIYILLFIPTITSFAAAFTNVTDIQSLLAIKDMISEDPFGFFHSWNNSNHFCHWQGVTCGRRHQRVIVLDLSSSNLVGTLAPEIGNLTFLEKIYLENNSIHGMIPQELGRLFRLKYLYLAMNHFEGEFPTNLTQCSRMQYLDLSRNNLIGEIPTGLGSLSDLSKLTLSYNRFTGIIPSSLGNLSSLSNLFLLMNNLQGNIPFELGLLSKLEYLQLGGNNLSGIVPISLYNSSSLLYLALAANQLVGSLPPDLFLALPNLQNFLFGQNKFYGSIPPSIVNASRIVQLDLARNGFIGVVPRNLGSLLNLELLYLNNNLLGGNVDDDLTFVASLTNCSNLSDLDLATNHFRGHLPDSIANLSTKLTSLALATNYISGKIPPGIGNLVNLIFLSLVENNMTGNIPNSIGGLSLLQVIGLSANALSGEIPFSIGNLTQLSILALERNKLEGRIPISLGNCTDLQGLDLSHNHLTGEIPRQIFGLTSLSIALSLHNNYLEGALPFEVGSLKNLGKFYIWQNKLSREIPSALGDCSVLEELYMGDNHFAGTIPSYFKNLKAIKILDISQNNLSGKIPDFLSELPSLETLNISFNMFEGEVPDRGVFRNLTIFSVNGNKELCGGIKELKLPACPGKLSKKEREHFPLRFIPLVIILPVVLFLVCLSLILYRVKRFKQQNLVASLIKEQYPKVSYQDLREATNGFSSSSLVGEGRYGSVYKGTLNSEEQIVAVKVIHLQQQGANKSFVAECEALRNIRHRNLVKIITCCSSTDFKGNDFKALVFEFMTNGNLESWLHPISNEQQDPNNLNLVRRLNIAIDVASALEYLHHQCETPIIHCDLKPSNILLDSDLCAHVGDFGLARFLFSNEDISDQAHSSTIGVRGTVGYIAPEYGMGEAVSAQGDIYSYGILLLEMFTGKRPTDNMLLDNVSLHNYAKMALPDQVMMIIDPQMLLDEEDYASQNRRGDVRTVECLNYIIRIGVMCSAESPSERMDITDVLAGLTTAKKVLFWVLKSHIDIGPSRYPFSMVCLSPPCA